MKINFDNIKTGQTSNTSAVAASPIKISIQSPVYSSVVRELSPHNYQREISNINSVISIPPEVATFIQREVEKEIRVSSSNQNIPKEINFIQRTSSEINLLSGYYFGKQKQVGRAKPKQTHHLNKLGATFNYKKHICGNHMPTEVKQTLNEVSQLTCHPALYPSALNKKATLLRKLQSEVNAHKKYSVYDHLYKQAQGRKIKAELNQIKQINRIPEPKPKINTSFYQKTKSSYQSIYNRLNTILEAKEARRKQKQGRDFATGRELFVPDTTQSRESYKAFFHSLSKEKMKVKNKQNKKLGLTTKRKKTEAHQKSELEVKKNQNPIDLKTIQYFTQIFYSQNEPLASLATSTASNPIKKSEFLVLHSFLHEIEEIQSKKYEMQTTVSSTKLSTATAKMNNVLSKQEFQLKFKKYYNKLSLHDRQILRKEVVKKKESEFRKEQNLWETTASFRPVINARSTSLDNLANGHAKNIYYV